MIDLNQLSDDELQGFLILYEMQKNECIVNQIAGRPQISDYSQDVHTLNKLKTEQTLRTLRKDE